MRETEAQTARRRGEGVRDVELARERQIDVAPAVATRQDEAASFGAQHRRLGVKVSRRVEPEGEGRAAPRDHVPRPVVLVHRRDGAGPEQVEQAKLGGEVLLHGAVVVEMVAGDVGERRGREDQSVEPSLVEAVRRRFHRHVADPARGESGEGPLQVDGARRRERAGRGAHFLPVPVEGTQGADASRARPGIEQMAHQGRRRGLAVGAGDAHQPHPVGRSPVPGLRRNQGRATRIAHQDFRNPVGDVPLDERQRGAAPCCVLHEIVPIGLGPRDRHEEGAGLDGATVTRNEANRRNDGRTAGEKPLPTQRIKDVFNRGNSHLSIINGR